MKNADKHKHLEFIQGVINRLARDSFLIKGWAVVLVSALVALSVRGSSPSITWFACVPIAMLWGLDGFFLWQERLYRKLYDHVRELDNDQIDFSMNAICFRGKRGTTWRGTLISRTLLPFYLVLLLATIAVPLLLPC